MIQNQNHQKSGNQPSHIVYSVEEREGEQQDIWTKVGAMWPHKDGKGFNLQMQFLPVNGNGRLTIRLNEPKSEQQPDSQAAA